MKFNLVLTLVEMLITVEQYKARKPFPPIAPIYLPYIYMWIIINQGYYIIIPPPQNVGGGLYWIRFVASVGRSVLPSPILVRSITPLLMEGFPLNLNDIFTSTRGCAEPMSHMCQLKVKVTVKCQILNKQI